MATEGIDPGLEELTDDALGIASEPASETQSQSQDDEQPITEQEPFAPAQQPQAGSALAPTPPKADTVEIEGSQFTREQLKAALQTAQQFPHLQKMWTDRLKQDEQARIAAQQPQGIPPTSAQVKASIRASFDPLVQQAVAEGLMESDFVELYPDISASMVMYRDSLGAVAKLLNVQAQKIAQYEREITSERTTADIKNNMVALSTHHAAFAPLGDPAVRDQFFAYLQQVDPRVDQLNDAQFMIGQWVAFKRNDFLGGVDQARTRAAAATAARGVQRRRAVGDALPGSRPQAIPARATTALDEMVDDFFAPRE